jgi:hypothetical protein
MSNRITLEPFKAAHVREVEEQCAVRLGPEDWALCEQQASAVTARVGDRVLLCGGVVQLWPDRGEAWMILNRAAGSGQVAQNRASALIARAVLDRCRLRRIEATVLVGPNEIRDRRWLNFLGFKLEAERLRRYFPTGHDAVLYARVRD